MQRLFEIDHASTRPTNLWARRGASIFMYILPETSVRLESCDNRTALAILELRVGDFVGGKWPIRYSKAHKTKDRKEGAGQKDQSTTAERTVCD